MHMALFLRVYTTPVDIHYCTLSLAKTDAKNVPPKTCIFLSLSNQEQSLHHIITIYKSQCSCWNNYLLHSHLGT